MGNIGPLFQRLHRPGRRFVLVAGVTGVGHLQRFSPGGRDEAKRMAAHIHAGDCLFDLRHMAGDALAARTAILVVRVFFDSCCARTVR